MRLQGDVARHIGLEVPHALADVLRGFFEGTVLQEPGKQQVAGLQVGIARLLVFLKTRQQVRGLHVEESRGDHQELRRTRQVRRRLHEGDEFVRHLGERHLGDVELLTRNERQEQVERTLEDGEGNGEKLELPLNLDRVRQRRHGR